MKKKIVYMLSIAVLLVYSQAEAVAKCKDDVLIRSWTFKSGNNDIFQLNQCSYGGNSKSGYLEKDNLTQYYVRACWEVIFNNGKKTEGCRNFDPYEKGSSSSCYSCNPKNDGVADTNLTCFVSSSDPNEKLRCNKSSSKKGFTNPADGNQPGTTPGTAPVTTPGTRPHELNNKRMCQKIDTSGNIVATWPPNKDGKCSGGPYQGGKSLPDSHKPKEGEIGDYTWRDGEQIAHQGAMIVRANPKCGAECDQCFQNYPEQAYKLLKSGKMHLSELMQVVDFRAGYLCESVGFPYCAANTICYRKPMPGITQ